MLRYLLLLVLLPLAANAHDSWLLAQSSEGAPRLTLTLTSGMAFPAPESAIKLDRIATTAARTLNARGDLTFREEIATASVFGAPRFTRSAVYGVALKPRMITLDAAQVAEYLRELDADSGVRERYGQLKTWRERYQKTAKAIVIGGSESAVGLAGASLFETLELTTPDDVNTLAPGQTMTVCAKRHDEAVAAQRIGIVYGGDKSEQWQVAGNDGCVTFNMASAGAILLRAIYLAASNQTGIDWESEFATLTLQLPPTNARR